MGEGVSQGFRSILWLEPFGTRRVCCRCNALLLEDDFRDNDTSLRGDGDRGGIALGRGLKVACCGDVLDISERGGTLGDVAFGDCDSGMPLA